MELSEADSGTRRQVGAGEPIAIRLRESATTGYRWNLDSTDDFEVIADRSFAAKLPPGAVGTRIIRVLPRRPGFLRLRLVKRRGWEKAAVDEFVLDLVVAGPD